MLLKAILKAAGFFYFTVLFYIFFLARRRPRPSFNRHLLPHNFVPLKNKWLFLQSYGSVTNFERGNFCIDIFGNIALFIPIPFFLALIFNIQAARKLLLMALGISLSIEISQYVLGIGVADVDDVILNTLGACIGIGLVKLAGSNKLLLPAIGINNK